MAATDTSAAEATKRVRDGLRAMFPRATHAVLFEVPNATGFGATRRCDAIVQSLWPSHGLALAGVEIKASRSDWLRELKDPSKSHAVYRYCDHWYLAVADAAIVAKNELPEGWGLIAPHGAGFRVKVRPAKLSPEPMTREFLAALLRAAASDATADATIEAARGEGYKQGYERGRSGVGAGIDEHDRRRLEELTRAVELIEREAGQLSGWNAGGVARAMALYRQRRDDGYRRNRLGALAEQLRDMAGEIEKARDAAQE